MDFFEFGRTFDAKIKRLKLPKDAQLQEPVLESTLPPLTWSVEFFIAFSDGPCIAVWEFWDKIKGLQDSRRIRWSYHYGAVAKDASGALVQAAADAPVMIRIDTCGGREHLHLRAREPHYPASAIQGVDLKGIDCWQFIRNIFRHRETGKLIEEIFGFKIVQK